MGAATYQNKVTLSDTAENLSAGLKAMTLGQITSFNEIVVSDGNELTLDANTFKNIDTSLHPAAIEQRRGVTITG